VLSLVPQSQAEARKKIEDPLEALKWQQVLGGERFLRKLNDHWNQRVERPKNYNSVAQTNRRTKTQDDQTLKVLKHQISHK
jgi:hypothetical protein